MPDLAQWNTLISHINHPMFTVNSFRYKVGTNDTDILEVISQFKTAVPDKCGLCGHVPCIWPWDPETPAEVAATVWRNWTDLNPDQQLNALKLLRMRVLELASFQGDSSSLRSVLGQFIEYFRRHSRPIADTSLSTMTVVGHLNQRTANLGRLASISRRYWVYPAPLQEVFTLINETGLLPMRMEPAVKEFDKKTSVWVQVFEEWSDVQAMSWSGLPTLGGCDSTQIRMFFNEISAHKVFPGWGDRSFPDSWASMLMPALTMTADDFISIALDMLLAMGMLLPYENITIFCDYPEETDRLKYTNSTLLSDSVPRLFANIVEPNDMQRLAFKNSIEYVSFLRKVEEYFESPIDVLNMTTDRVRQTQVEALLKKVEEKPPPKVLQAVSAYSW